MAESKDAMLNGGPPNKVSDRPGVKITKHDSRSSVYRLVKIGTGTLFGVNFVLAVVVVILAALPKNGVDLDHCITWKSNMSDDLTGLLNQITDAEVNRTQEHYLGWSRDIDPDVEWNHEESREEPAKAHFATYTPCPEDDKSGPYETLCWNQTCRQTFCFSPLKYESGKIRVLSSGYYFVYSRLLFDVSDLTEEWVSLTHDIMRQPGERPEMKILETRNVVTKPREDKVRSYLGAVFYLYPKDAISVRINRRNRRYFSEDRSYFGMFRI